MADLTCEERIEAHLASRLDTFRTIMRIASGGDANDDTPCDEYEALDDAEPDGECANCDFDRNAHEQYEKDSDPPEYDSAESADDAWFALPLSVDTKMLVTIALSTGGPGDQFECVVDPDGMSIDSITYRFLDWFDGATRPVMGDDYEVAEQFLNRFVDGAVQTLKHGETGW